MKKSWNRVNSCNYQFLQDLCFISIMYPSCKIHNTVGIGIGIWWFWKLFLCLQCQQQQHRKQLPHLGKLRQQVSAVSFQYSPASLFTAVCFSHLQIQCQFIHSVLPTPPSQRKWLKICSNLNHQLDLWTSLSHQNQYDGFLVKRDRNTMALTLWWIGFILFLLLQKESIQKWNQLQLGPLRAPHRVNNGFFSWTAAGAGNKWNKNRLCWKYSARLATPAEYFQHFLLVYQMSSTMGRHCDRTFQREMEEILTPWMKVDERWELRWNAVCMSVHTSALFSNSPFRQCPSISSVLSTFPCGWKFVNIQNYLNPDVRF